MSVHKTLEVKFGGRTRTREDPVEESRQGKEGTTLVKSHNKRKAEKKEGGTLSTEN